MKDNTELIATIRRFQSLQERRARTYKKLDEQHRRYLESAPNYNFLSYRQIVHDVTEEFKVISEEIIRIALELKDVYHHENLKGFILQVQEYEAEKLNIAVQLQLAKQNEVDFPTEEKYHTEVRELKRRSDDVINSINEQLEEIRFELEEL